MKKEAGMVFGLPDNSPIKVVFGKVIDAQSYVFQDPESDEELILLEFRLKPDLDPDQKSLVKASEEDDLLFLNNDRDLIQSISLFNEEDIPTAIEFIDKAIIYLYATHGLNCARLVQGENGLSFADTDQDTMSAENALAVVAALYSIHGNLQEDDISADSIYETVMKFAAIINLGDCERNELGNVLHFPDLIDQSLTEFYDGKPQEPDVVLTLHEDYTMTLRHDNEHGNEVSQVFKISRESILDVMEELWSIGKERGYCGDRELGIVTNVIALGDSHKVSMDQAVQLMVPKQMRDPKMSRAFKDFMNSDVPSQSLN